MFTTEELKMLYRAMCWYQDDGGDNTPAGDALRRKVHELHSRALGYPMSIRGIPGDLLATIDEACAPWDWDITGVPMPTPDGTTKMIYEGPNYRSGVQGEKFRRLDPAVMNRILRTIYPNEMG